MPDKPSFPETADIETSSDGYAGRFAGPVGEWFLTVQEQIVLGMIGNLPGGQTSNNEPSVLDVGGGHGQLAGPLCRAGFRVMVIGSDQSCSRRISHLLSGGKCSFQVGNLVDLPFADQSFDTVLCFRFLPHCTQWPKLIGELCRVARKQVIVDYPSRRSFNAVVPLLFGAKRRVEKNTREWTNFSHSDIRDQFAAHGFTTSRLKGQFFLPMALHRAMKAKGLSAGLEAVCRVIGLTALFGSPVILETRRREGRTS